MTEDIHKDHPDEKNCEYCHQPILGMEMAIDHFSRMHPQKSFDPVEYMVADTDVNLGTWVVSEYT